MMPLLGFLGVFSVLLSAVKSNIWLSYLQNSASRTEIVANFSTSSSLSDKDVELEWQLTDQI